MGHMIIISLNVPSTVPSFKFLKISQQNQLHSTKFQMEVVKSKQGNPSQKQDKKRILTNRCKYYFSSDL